MKRFLLAFFMLAAGIVLLIFHNHPDVLRGMAIFIGIMLILPGVLNILISAFSRRAEKTGDPHTPTRARYIGGLVLSIFLVALGVAMIVAAQIFVGVLVYLLAAILIAAGFYHLLVLGIFSRPAVLPWYLYIVPVLMIAAGCVLIFWMVVRTTPTIFLLITGIAFICSAINSLLEHVGFVQDHRARRDQASLDQAAETKPEATAATTPAADSDSETTNE